MVATQDLYNFSDEIKFVVITGGIRENLLFLGTCRRYYLCRRSYMLPAWTIRTFSLRDITLRASIQ